MPDTAPTILIVAQSGRLTYEAVLFAASLRAAAPDFKGKLVVAEPQPGPLWRGNPGIVDIEARTLLTSLGADIRQFQSHHFGQGYPHGNKVEALATLAPDEPFIFFDTDTLVTGHLDHIAFDFDRPAASMARTATWPEPPLYGPGYREIWGAIFARFDVPIEPTLDLSHPEDHWERYLYFNAGWFFARDPAVCRTRRIEVMTSLRDDPLEELAAQSLFPWLDQIALPVVIAALGGGRPDASVDGLDGDVTDHWRALPLFYARASDEKIAFFEALTAPNKIKRVLKNYDPFKRIIFQGRGRRARDLFDRSDLPPKEQTLRARLKSARLWMR